ncbi:hypothetical protein BDV23DRAFT_174668 [Aspergillus alliaceus]|uniref:Uncharacterized protein n=1 Tax=Petromyces alliaceus TaxID=209559 RepID=A0A5N7C083_PETAA|nr:hypothetical protein BDV23DRAFT_174668 [Aspergillus alliaceus]
MEYYQACGYHLVKICTASSNSLEIDVLSKLPAKMSLSDAKNGSSLAAQLTIAIRYMHSQEFVPEGLHRGNTLFQSFRGLNQLSTEQLYELHAKLIQELVKALPETKILLSDFDEAFSPLQEEKFKSQTSLLIRPPEAHRFTEHGDPIKEHSWQNQIWEDRFAMDAQRPRILEGLLALDSWE